MVAAHLTTYEVLLFGRPPTIPQGQLHHRQGKSDHGETRHHWKCHPSRLISEFMPFFRKITTFQSRKISYPLNYPINIVLNSQVYYYETGLKFPYVNEVNPSPSVQFAFSYNLCCFTNLHANFLQKMKTDEFMLKIKFQGLKPLSCWLLLHSQNCTNIVISGADTFFFIDTSFFRVWRHNSVP